MDHGVSVDLDISWQDIIGLNAVSWKQIDPKYTVCTSCNVLVFPFLDLMYQSIEAFVGTFEKLSFDENFAHPKVFIH